MERNFQRTPARPVTDFQVALPEAQVGDDVDAAAIAGVVIPRLSTLGIEAFTQNAVWRDSLALTGTFRTFYSATALLKAWKDTCSTHVPADFAPKPKAARIVRVGTESSWVDAAFTFRNTAANPQQRCSGFVSLIPDANGEWKIWILRTILEDFDGWGTVDALSPGEMSSLNITATNGSTNGTLTNKVGSEENLIQHFDCIVVGGGQAGLGIGGRLQALDVTYLIVDKHPAVGDSWKTRYDSTKLHTAREYGHLPFYRTFGQDYPEFLTKDHIATGHQDYVRRYGINIWTSTEMVSSSWSTDSKKWTCRLIRGGEEVNLTTFHLIFAPGAGSETPSMPIYPGTEHFQGTILHSADYKNPAEWRGKRGLIIGTANTAHDVADDMLEHGLSSVTMVQRGRTWVLPAEHYMAVTIPLYNETIPTEVADRSSFSWPIPIHRQMARHFLHTMARQDSERYKALEKAGFNVEQYGDITHIMYERMGGHYMDVGTSAKVAKGLIHIKSGATPTHYTPDGLAFSDGTELKADVIVFATGFVGNVREMAGSIVGQEIEDQLEDFWELDAEGEIRGAFKYTGHPGIWFAGGPIGIARYYGRFIALQIKAQLMGSPLEVYKDSATVDANGHVREKLNGFSERS